MMKMNFSALKESGDEDEDEDEDESSSGSSSGSSSSMIFWVISHPWKSIQCLNWNL